MRGIRKGLVLAAVGGAIGLVAPASAATTFFNDWESTDFGDGPGFTILPAYEGWTASAGPGIEVQYNNVAGTPFSGENLVELDSNSNSTMSRVIEAGDYTLSFWYSDRPNVGADSNGIDVLLDDVSLLTVAGAQGGGDTNWVFYTVNFSTGGGTLSFAANGTSDSLGGYLDDVGLEGAIPEPSTWAMMLIGFGVVGASMRRRPSRASFA